MTHDLAIVGAGPAGCAAAVMADSLGLSTVVVEAAPRIGGLLSTIPVIKNMIGFSTGAEMIAAMEKSLAALARCDVRLGCEVTSAGVGVGARDGAVTLTLAGGDTIVAGRAVIATGTTDLGLDALPWVDLHGGLDAPPLWQISSRHDDGGPILVVGADRVVASVLRSRPDLESRMVVVASEADAYKLAEVAGYGALRTIPARRVTLRRAGDVVHARVTAEEGEVGLEVAPDAVYVNAGKVARLPAGAAAAIDRHGYPTRASSGWLYLAGDVKSHRGQRIATALGMGADAALRAYYDAVSAQMIGVPARSPTA